MPSLNFGRKIRCSYIKKRCTQCIKSIKSTLFVQITTISIMVWVRSWHICRYWSGALWDGQLLLVHVPRLPPTSTRSIRSHWKTRNLSTNINSSNHWSGSILDGLKNRQLTSKVNVLLTSDHGMEAISVHRSINLENYIDATWVLRPRQTWLWA